MSRLIYTSEQILEKTLSIAAHDMKHCDYTRCVERAAFYSQVITGEDQEGILLKIRPRDSKEKKEQRLHFTNTLTKSECNRIYQAFKQVQRRDNMPYVLTPRKDNEDISEKVKEHLDNYTSNKSLVQYTHEAVLYHNFYDPNAWHVIESSTDREGDVYFYPLEVSSEDAAYFESENGWDQFMTMKSTWTATCTEEENKEADKWITYAPETTYEVRRIPDDYIGEYEGERIEYAMQDAEPIVFDVISYNHGLPFIPAKRYGYMPDPKTNKRTYIGVLEPASELWVKLIWDWSMKSLYDYLHGFYKRFQIVLPCAHSEVVGGEVHQCEGGVVNGSKCNSCGGTGWDYHTSEQDVVQIHIQDPDNIPDISKLVHYEKIDTELMRKKDEDIEKVRHKIFESIFNVNPFTRGEVSMTATEKVLENQAMNNTFGEMGEAISMIWGHSAQTIIGHMGYHDAFLANKPMPKDYELETLDQLIAQKSSAISANLSTEATQALEAKIIKKLSKESEASVDKWAAREDFRPWRKKSTSEIMNIMIDMDDRNYHKVLYTYFESIFRDIEHKEPNFHVLSYDKQKEIVQQCVEEFTISVYGEVEEPLGA